MITADERTYLERLLAESQRLLALPRETAAAQMAPDGPRLDAGLTLRSQFRLRVMVAVRHINGIKPPVYDYLLIGDVPLDADLVEEPLVAALATSAKQLNHHLWRGSPPL
jgi:hypothetical protein